MKINKEEIEELKKELIENYLPVFRIRNMETLLMDIISDIENRLFYDYSTNSGETSGDLLIK